MASYSQADFGLEFLRCVAEDGRMTRGELVEIIQYAANSFVEGKVDKAKAEHAGRLLCKGFVSSRGSREPGSFGRHPYDDLDESVQHMPTRVADPKGVADQILRAAAKARGELVELPPVGSTARMILETRQRATDPDHPLGGGKK